MNLYTPHIVFFFIQDINIIIVHTIDEENEAEVDPTAFFIDNTANARQHHRRSRKAHHDGNNINQVHHFIILHNLFKLFLYNRSNKL